VLVEGALDSARSSVLAPVCYTCGGGVLQDYLVHRKTALGVVLL